MAGADSEPESRAGGAPVAFLRGRVLWHPYQRVKVNFQQALVVIAKAPGDRRRGSGDYLRHDGAAVTGPGATAVTYGPSDEVTLIGKWAHFDRVEQRVFNSPGQLTVQKGMAWPFTTETYEFWNSYADGANNGRITQFRDQKSGEEVAYTYDAVNRLVKAEATANSSVSWGETMAYDGFGNLTGEQPTKGSAPYYRLTMDAGTNRFLNAGFAYDGAENMTGVSQRRGAG